MPTWKRVFVSVSAYKGDFNMTKRITTISLFLAVRLAIVVLFGFVPFSAFAAEDGQYIRFEYLKRIPNTPFAEKIQTVIKVPVYDNHEIKLQDVKKALKVSSFGVMQSYSDTFTYNAKTDTYSTVYYKSVYLNAKTVDGNSKNFYLDCNLSFEEYFKPFVANGTLEASIYEFYLNNIHIRYSGLDGYTADNIYGYFGLIPIPRGRDLNQLWADLFGQSTNYKGVLENYMYTNVLTNAAHKKLLEEYNYSWLAVVWKGFIDKLASGSVNADFYMVYVDSQTTEAMIAENGAHDIGDNSGLIFNKVKDGVTNVANKVKDFFSDKKNIALVIGLALGLLLFVGLIFGIVYMVKTMFKDVAKDAAKGAASSKKRKR